MRVSACDLFRRNRGKLTIKTMQTEVNPNEVIVLIRNLKIAVIMVFDICFFMLIAL